MASANLPPEALHSPWSEHDQFLTPDKPPDKLAGEPRHGTAEDALRTSSSSGAALLNRTFEPEKEYENGKEYGILAENGAQGRVELELELEPDAPLDDSNPDDADDNGKNKIPVDFWPRVAYQTREFFYPSAITEPPRITKPLLGKYSIKLVKLFERLPKWANYLLLFLFYFAWAATIVTITYFSTYHSQVIPYAGDDPVDPQWIGCYASLWSRNSGCGVNGANCEPFTNASFALRCSPKCLLAKTGEQYWIGNTTVNKQPVIVGSGPYRGDSWLCMAAMHSGLVTDRSGGCMVVELAGEADYFEGSSRYGVSSSTFPSQFPKSFNVKPCFESPNCADLAWASLTALGIFAFFASTLTPSPSSLFFYTLSLLGFFWVVFGDYSSPRADSNFLSKAFAQVLPTLAVSYALYQTVVRTVLPPLVATHGLDVFIFYILPYILGLDLVELLTYLPDLTLTAKALQDPAQIGMLVGSVVIIGGFGVYFLYWQRKLRRLPWMVLLYGVFFAFFFSVPLIFNLYPHLHHYMVALLLIPMTMDVQSRPSFIFQGFCVGWFLEGVGRWGFDTPAETRERFVGAGLWNSARPSWENASLALWRNGSLSWTFPAEAGEVYTDLDSFDAQRGAGISGYSLLMNDFPVYSGPLASFALNGTANYFDMKAGNGTTPFFWRVAGVQSDGTVLDYSDVLQGFGNGTLRFPNGSWWDPD